MVEYIDIPAFAEGHVLNPPSCPGGHGRRGPGGHYTGKCLCSPAGCEADAAAAAANQAAIAATVAAVTGATVPQAPPPAPQAPTVAAALPPVVLPNLAAAAPAQGAPIALAPAAVPASRCTGYPNPFYDEQFNEQANCAIISMEHVIGWVPGQTFVVGQQVIVRTVGVPLSPDCALDENGFAVHLGDGDGGVPAAGKRDMPPQLWKGGLMGGRAIVRSWRLCGGRRPKISWHGDKILAKEPWRVEEEDASILLLEEDGSTGLDLSFATHIFLLDPIKDPALRNQIVSRAHRMGATGPVQVQLVQVESTREEHD